MLFVLWKFPSESSRVAPALLDPGGGQDRSSWPEVPELLKAGRGERRRSSPQAELQDNKLPTAPPFRGEGRAVVHAEGGEEGRPIVGERPYRGVPRRRGTVPKLRRIRGGGWV